jgi:enoyl-CoA hydratase/carnithine racemase
VSDLILEQRVEEGRVAILTLNRPEVMNCISTALIEALDEALATAVADREVRAIILTGAGEKAFCTGMDLKERVGMTASLIGAQRRKLISALAFLHRQPKPTIAAVQGAAMGGGFELALCCDLVVAEESARFALPEVKVGIMPAGGGTQTLTWQIGPARTRDLVLTGRAVSAAEAHQWGIVARLVPQGEAVSQAIALATDIARNAPIGLRQAKAAIRRAYRVLGAGLDEEDEFYQAVLDSEDRIEGFTAFKEKRPPRFQGR